MAIQRDHLVDNLKALLIILVVAGHFMEIYMEKSQLLKVVFVCIYSFHMPLFVFISGYLSRSANSSNVSKITKTLLLPYLLFAFLWYVRASVHVKPIFLDVLSPPFHLWYLLALFMWRILIPVIKSFKYYIAVSICLSLMVGMSMEVDNMFALSRALSLFPFFLLGNYCTPDIIDAIRKQKVLAALGIASLLALGAYITVYQPANRNILFWNQPYLIAGFSNNYGMLLRFGLIALASLISIAVIVIIPANKGILSHLGTRTITIYVFHGFFIHPFAARFPEWGTGILHHIIILLFPLLLIEFLSLPVLDKWYHKTFDWIGKILLSPY